MARSQKIEDVMHLCFKEMFLRVGEIYPNEELQKDKKWYMRHSWTVEQENNFRKWMIRFLMKGMRWSKKVSEKETSFFIFNYGWTTKKRSMTILIKN